MTLQIKLKETFYDILDSISEATTQDTNKGNTVMQQNIKALLPVAPKKEGAPPIVIVQNQSFTINNMTALVSQGLRLVDQIDQQQEIINHPEPAAPLVEFLANNHYSWKDAQNYFKTKYLQYIHREQPTTGGFAERLNISSGLASTMMKQLRGNGGK